MLHLFVLFTMVFVESDPDSTAKSVLKPVERSSLLQVEAQHYPETTHTIHTTYKPHTTTQTIHHNWGDESYTNTNGVSDVTLDDVTVDDGQIDGSSTPVLSSWLSLRDATIVASSSLSEDSLPENLKGPAHSIWVSATNQNEWLTFSFPNGQTIDGIRVWNVKTNYFFKDYTLSISENGGHDWYRIKTGSTTYNMECCNFYEIRFPVVHSNMFQLGLTDKHDTGTYPFSLSYIEFHFLPDPDILCPYYAVPFKGYCYAVMDKALFSMRKETLVSSCQSMDNVADTIADPGGLRLPIGWAVAVFSDEVVANVVKSPACMSVPCSTAYTEVAQYPNVDTYHWGTQYVVFSDDKARNTQTGADVDSTVGFEIAKPEDGVYTVENDVYSVLTIDKIDGPSTKQRACKNSDKDAVLATAKVLMQLPWNNLTTARYNPPFVSRSDKYNNVLFERD